MYITNKDPDRWLEQDDLDCKVGDTVQCIFNGKLVKGKIKRIQDLLHNKKNAMIWISDTEIISVPLKFCMKE